MAAAGALAAGLLLAQEPVERPDIVVDVNNVQVPVTVRDSKGNFVSGLVPVDFQLLDEGVPQTIVQDVGTHPISLVIAIQSDATARQILPTVQKTASIFGPLVAGETGEIAVIGFDGTVRVHSGFTSNQEEIKAAFGKLRPGSGLHKREDATMEAINMLRNRGKDRKKVVILISETRDRGSAFSERDVLTNAEFSNVQIYPISMNHLLNQLTTQAEPNRPNAIPPENRPPLPMGQLRTGTTDAQTNMGNWTPIIREIFEAVKGIFVPNGLEVYSRFTGGREFNFVSLGGLEEAVREIGEEIHSQYLLTFNPTSKKGGYHKIEVRMVSAANVKITTRDGYWIGPRGPDEKGANK